MADPTTGHLEVAPIDDGDDDRKQRPS